MKNYQAMMTNRKHGYCYDEQIRRDHPIKAVENAIKLKYQSQTPNEFAYVKKEIRSRFVELQQQNSSNGNVEVLMSAVQDCLDLEEKNTHC